jgi:hypothetical protein
MLLLLNRDVHYANGGMMSPMGLGVKKRLYRGGLASWLGVKTLYLL